MKKRRYLLLWGVVPLFVIIILFMIVPLGYMVIASFQQDNTKQWTMLNYYEILTNPYYFQSFGNSAIIAFFSSVVGLIGSLVFCQSLLHLPKKTQEKLTLFSNLAANFAGVPLAFGFIIVLGNAGVLRLMLPVLQHFDLYSWKGLVLTYVYFQIPLATLFLYPVMKKIRYEWRESAELLGAKPGRYYRKIVLPFLLPSLSATFAILFANAMGTYETAYALVGSNINLVTTRISALVAGDVYAKPNLGSALAVLFALSMIVVIALSQLLLKRLRKDMIF